MRVESSVKYTEALGEAGGQYIVTTIVKDLEFFQKESAPSVFRDIAQAQIKEIAEEYVKQNQAEVLKYLDPQAIANLALADAARGIRENIIDPPKKKKD